MSKNAEVLKSFVEFCEANPELRFWQALRNWSGFGFIYVSNAPANTGLYDTFYREGL